MSTLTTSQSFTRSQPIWRFVVIGLAVAVVATGATIAITSGGGSTGSRSQSASQKSDVSDLQSYAPDYAGRRPPVAQAAVVATITPRTSAAQLRQYIGNHGDPRGVPANRIAHLPAGYEPQTPGARP